MTRRARLWTSLIVGMAISPWLPLYLGRAMTRSTTAGGGGDHIEYGWTLHTLGGFVEAMRYMRPEQHPQRMLALDLGLAVVYAGLLALGCYLVLGQKFRGSRNP